MREPWKYVFFRISSKYLQLSLLYITFSNNGREGITFGKKKIFSFLVHSLVWFLFLIGEKGEQFTVYWIRIRIMIITECLIFIVRIWNRIRISSWIGSKTTESFMYLNLRLLSSNLKKSKTLKIPTYFYCVTKNTIITRIIRTFGLDSSVHKCIYRKSPWLDLKTAKKKDCQAQ